MTGETSEVIRDLTGETSEVIRDTTGETFKAIRDMTGKISEVIRDITYRPPRTNPPPKKANKARNAIIVIGRDTTRRSAT
jgi:hypothetical protein